MLFLKNQKNSLMWKRVFVLYKVSGDRFKSFSLACMNFLLFILTQSSQGDKTKSSKSTWTFPAKSM